jgi:hypothetical protein
MDSDILAHHDSHRQTLCEDTAKCQFEAVIALIAIMHEQQDAQVSSLALSPNGIGCNDLSCPYLQLDGPAIEEDDCSAVCTDDDGNATLHPMLGKSRICLLKSSCEGVGGLSRVALTSD